MRVRNKIIIIFFSCVLVILIGVLALVKYFKHVYSELESIMSEIDGNNDYIYYDEFVFYYKGQKHHFNNYIDMSSDHFIIEYIDKEHLIYSKKENDKYFYYMFEDCTNGQLIFTSQQNYSVCSFRNNILYIKYGDMYSAYDIINGIDEELSLEDFYYKAYNTKYTLSKENIITDTTTNASKKITLEMLLKNNTLKDLNDIKRKIFYSKLHIEKITFFDDDIYIIVSTNGIRGITLKYDFDLDMVEIIDKFEWEYIDNVEMYYLGKNDCQPVEFLFESCIS